MIRGTTLRRLRIGQIAHRDNGRSQPLHGNHSPVAHIGLDRNLRFVERARNIIRTIRARTAAAVKGAASVKSGCDAAAINQARNNWRLRADGQPRRANGFACELRCMRSMSPQHHIIAASSVGVGRRYRKLGTGDEHGRHKPLGDGNLAMKRHKSHISRFFRYFNLRFAECSRFEVHAELETHHLPNVQWPLGNDASGRCWSHDSGPLPARNASEGGTRFQMRNSN